MYPEDPAARSTPVRGAGTRRVWRAVPWNVWAIGVTSLLTDISSEMVTSTLPLFVVVHQQMSPLAFGAIESLYIGVATLVRVAGGVVADRVQRPKAVAALGYGMSAAAKIAFLIAGAMGPLFVTALVADRLGKGVRTAPRDALIARHAASGGVATAFGVHRAMDAAGAMIGPLVAFAVLRATPGRFDQVFAVSAAFAVVGVAALVLLVQEPDRQGGDPRSPVRWSRLASAMRAPAFRAVIVAACALSAVTVSDALLYLVLQRAGAVEPSILPLLFVGTFASYFVFAAPAGAAADRLGARGVFIAGHVALLLLYALLWATPARPMSAALCVTLLGMYYATTDGVLASLASTVLPVDVRATGLGLLATVTTGARALAAMAFSALWTYASAPVAMGVFGIGMVAAIVIASISLMSRGEAARAPDGAGA